MKKKCIILFACAFIFAAVVGETRNASFTGTWNTNWGPLEMLQKGDKVMGHYTGQFKGIIDGTVSGNRLSFTWSQPNSEHGRGFFIISENGNSIDGAWGTEESESNGGSWTGTRVSSSGNN